MPRCRAPVRFVVRGGALHAADQAGAGGGEESDGDGAAAGTGGGRGSDSGMVATAASNARRRPTPAEGDRGPASTVRGPRARPADGGAEARATSELDPRVPTEAPRAAAAARVVACCRRAHGETLRSQSRIDATRANTCYTPAPPNSATGQHLHVHTTTCAVAVSPPLRTNRLRGDPPRSPAIRAVPPARGTPRAAESHSTHKVLPLQSSGLRRLEIRSTLTPQRLHPPRSLCWPPAAARHSARLASRDATGLAPVPLRRGVALGVAGGGGRVPNRAALRVRHRRRGAGGLCAALGLAPRIALAHLVGKAQRAERLVRVALLRRHVDHHEGLALAREAGLLRCEYANLRAGDLGRYGEMWAAYVVGTPASGREIWGDMGRCGQSTWWVRQPQGGRTVSCRVFRAPREYERLRVQ